VPRNPSELSFEDVARGQFAAAHGRGHFDGRQ
jgi:hypothetical protein